jgi:hypothetical protein
MNSEERSISLWERSGHDIESRRNEGTDQYLAHVVKDYFIPKLKKIKNTYPRASLITAPKTVTLKFTQNRYISFTCDWMFRLTIEWVQGRNDGLNYAVVQGLPLYYINEIVETYLGESQGTELRNKEKVSP